MASSKSIHRGQEPVIDTCCLCDSKDNVNWYCNDCQETLCDRCKEGHSRGKKTKNDDIVPIGQAKRQADRAVPEVCNLHAGKLQEFFCSDCKKVVCSICLSKTHKQHNWKHLEETVTTVKRHLNEHMTTISQKVELFKAKIFKLESANITSVKNIDACRKEVNYQRTKLLAEVNSVADLVLSDLLALEKEESGAYKTVCQQYQTKVRELTRMHEQAEVAITSTSVGSMLETNWSLSTSLPRYDVDVKTVLPKPPRFVAGNINRDLLRQMLGELHYESQYEKKNINSTHVQQISKFTVTQETQIFCICPVDHSHAWVSIHGYKGLVLVSKEGVVTDTVELDFFPRILALVGTTDILMTSCIPLTAFVYKLSLHNKQLTTFADISPHKAFDLSIHQTGEVYVSTVKGDIVVLDQSGTIARKVSRAGKDFYVACMSAGIAISTGNFIASNVSIIDNSGTTLQKWSGELDNGQTANSMNLWKMSCDRYDRLFVPDYNNHQVYILPKTSTRAICLLDRKHGVKAPISVGVDTCGDLWIGCENGTVHVMRL